MVLCSARSRCFNLWQGLKDRLRGNHAKANARWGYLQDFAQYRKKLIWVVAPRSRDGGRVAAGLAQSISDRRQDIITVLTYQQEYEEVAEQLKQGDHRLFHGFGPCDHPAAVKRALKRLSPFAVIFVEQTPPRNLLQALTTRSCHVVTVDNKGGWQEIQAENQIMPQADSVTAQSETQQADPLTLLTHSHVEPVLKGSIPGAQHLDFIWMHGVVAPQLPPILEAWSQASLSASAILFLSPLNNLDKDSAEKPARVLGLSLCPIEQWSASHAEAKQLVWVDDPAWFVRLAASVSAIHLLNYDRSLYWLAASLGAPMSYSSGTSEVLPQKVGDECLISDNWHDLLSYWGMLLQDSFRSRQLVDKQRQRFWSERRMAQSQIERLLQRVYEW